MLTSSEKINKNNDRHEPTTSTAQHAPDEGQKQKEYCEVTYICKRPPLS